MSKANVTKWTVIGGLAVSLLLVGCGNRLPANVPEPDAEPSANPGAPASTAPSTAPAPTPPPAVTTPAYTSPMAGSLTVSGVEKSKTGFIFKKFVVKGEVVNTSQVPCSGTLKVDFKDKKGIFTKTFVTEETKTVEIATLAPGAKQSFEVTSDKSGHDEVEVTVQTRQSAGSTGAAMTGAAMSGGAYGAAAASGRPAPGAAY